MCKDAKLMIITQVSAEDLIIITHSVLNSQEKSAPTPVGQKNADMALRSEKMEFVSQ